MKPLVDIFKICSIATTESSAEQVMAAAEEIVVITTLKEAKQRYVCVRDARAAAFVIYTQVPAGNGAHGARGGRDPRPTPAAPWWSMCRYGEYIINTKP
jgi:hypothetical protein